MKFDYLRDDSENSLAPFFSPVMLSHTLTYLSALTLILIVLWPHGSLFRFLKNDRVPLAYFCVFTGAMLMISYISLIAGRGEAHPSDYFSRLKRDAAVTYEEKNDFISYGLIAFMLHTVFLIFLSMPLLILASIISWLSVPDFCRALLLIFISALLCRCFSFFIYLSLGKWGFPGLFLTRVFYLALFFLSGLLAPSLNPAVLLWGFGKNMTGRPETALSRYAIYMLITVTGVIMLTGINQFLIRRKRLREKTG